MRVALALAAVVMLSSHAWSQNLNECDKLKAANAQTLRDLNWDRVSNLEAHVRQLGLEVGRRGAAVSTCQQQNSDPLSQMLDNCSSEISAYNFSVTEYNRANSELTTQMRIVQQALVINEGLHPCP